MDIDYLIPALLFIAGLALRCGYELLKDARRIDAESKPVFALILTAMCTLWVSWFILCPLDPFRINLPGAVRWSGFGLFAAGLVAAVGALLQLGGVENIDHLVTTGFFRKIRHPMYAGFIAWILGWSVYHGAFVSLGIGLFGIVAVLWWRHLEERRLERQFGNAYRQYMRSTWF